MNLILSIGFGYFKSMLKYTSRVVLVVAVIITVISLFIKAIIPSYRISQNRVNTYERDRIAMYKIVNDPLNNKTATQKGSIAGLRTITCFFIGETCSVTMNSPKNNQKNSFIGRLSGLVALPYMNPPASGVYVVHQTLSNFGFLPHAYAAEGIGFASLSPLFNVWKALRDIALMVVVIIIIVIGFLIMFRMKLNQQTVIGIENALPKIIVSMLLITFSFAIVGFLIDMMYVLMALIISVLGPLANIPSDQLITKFLFAGPDDIFSLFSDPTHRGLWLTDILFSLPNAMMRAIPAVSDMVQIAGTFIGFYKIFPFIWNNLMSSTWGNLFNIDFSVPFLALDGPIMAIAARIIMTVITLPIAFSLAAFLIPIIIGILILVTVISLFFRVLMMVFRSYIVVLMLTILSPVILLFDAIPSQSAFSNWFRTIASELITFPALVTMLLIGVIIGDAMSAGFLTQFPFLQGINGNSLSLITGMMLMFMIPDLVKKIKLKIQPKPMTLENAGLGVFFTGAAAGLSTVGGAKGLTSVFIPEKIKNSFAGTFLENIFPQSESQRNQKLIDAITKASGGGGAGGGGAGGGGAPHP